MDMHLIRTDNWITFIFLHEKAFQFLRKSFTEREKRRWVKLSDWDISSIFSSLLFQRLKKLYPERIPSFFYDLWKREIIFGTPKFLQSKSRPLLDKPSSYKRGDFCFKRLAMSPKWNDSSLCACRCGTDKFEAILCCSFHKQSVASCH